MHPARIKMNRALKAIVVPKLRQLGFKGSFPHFRRIHGDRVDLLVFQFYSAGGSFVVELAGMSADEIDNHWDTDLSFETATAYSAGHNKRYRLGAPQHGGDSWFVFGKRTYELDHDLVGPDAVYEEVAQRVKSLIECEAERCWSTIALTGAGPLKTART